MIKTWSIDPKTNETKVIKGLIYTFFMLLLLASFAAYRKPEIATFIFSIGFICYSIFLVYSISSFSVYDISLREDGIELKEVNSIGKKKTVTIKLTEIKKMSYAMEIQGGRGIGRNDEFFVLTIKKTNKSSVSLWAQKSGWPQPVLGDIYYTVSPLLDKDKLN